MLRMKQRAAFKREIYKLMSVPYFPHLAFLVQRKPLKEKRMKEDWPASQNVKS
jgi:hypothetical protein